MSEADEGVAQSLGGERARLINERLVELFEVRAKCERARALDGAVPEEHQLAFHNAIVDAYLALRPSRDEPPVRDWWDSVALSERWGERTHKTESDLVGDGGDMADAEPVLAEDGSLVHNDDGEALYVVFEPYEGLDTLDEQRDIVTERAIERDIVGGTVSETVAQPEPLPYDVQRDISQVLEDAAGRLGFKPPSEIPDDTEGDLV